MPSYFILVPILLPVIAGILLLVFPIEDARKRNICIEIIVVINTLLVLWLLTHRPSESFYMFSLGARSLLQRDFMCSFMWIYFQRFSRC